MREQERTPELAAWRGRSPGREAVGSGTQLQIAPSEYETINGLLRVLRRRKILVAAVTLLLALTGTAACFMMTPSYSATTTLEVVKESASEASAPQVPGLDSDTQLKTELQTDVDILQSRSLALAVIKDLNLTAKKPFAGAVDSGEKGRRIEEAPRTTENLVRVFEKNLKVKALPDSKLLTITFDNSDPGLAAGIANTLAREFIDNTLELQHRSTAQASFWLRGELEDLRRKVEESEKSLADYQRENGLAGIEISGVSGGEGTSSVSVSPHNTVVEKLFSLNQELTSAEASRISAETMYRLVQGQDPEVVLGLGTMAVPSGNSGGAGVVLPEGVDLLRSLRAQEGSLQRDYASYSVKYGVNNPRLLQLQQQTEAVQSQIKAELGRITGRARNAYEYARRNEDTIRGQFTKQQTAANQMADSTVKLQVLAQEAYSNRALYEGLFSKLQAANLSSGVRATRIDVVEAATTAGTPTSPSYFSFLAVVAALALFLGVASGFIRESMDETIRTMQDFDLIHELPVLVYLPNVSTAKLTSSQDGQSQLILSPASPFSEAFRSLRAAVLMESQEYPAKTILVTSALAGDGKTTVVYNLGIAIAQQGLRVLVVDGDLRSPSLHNSFGARLSPGLSDLRDWRTGTSIPGVVSHPQIANLSLLPAGSQRHFPAEFFGSSQFDAIVKASASQYDYVLIDSPPMLPVADAQIISGKVGGLIAVLRSGRTPRPQLARLLHRMHRVHAPAMGFILNDVKQPSLHGFEEYSYYPRGGETASAYS